MERTAGSRGGPWPASWCSTSPAAAGTAAAASTGVSVQGSSATVQRGGCKGVQSNTWGGGSLQGLLDWGSCGTQEMCYRQHHRQQTRSGAVLLSAMLSMHTYLPAAQRPYTKKCCTTRLPLTLHPPAHPPRCRTPQSSSAAPPRRPQQPMLPTNRRLVGGRGRYHESSPAVSTHAGNHTGQSTPPLEPSSAGPPARQGLLDRCCWSCRSLQPAAAACWSLGASIPLKPATHAAAG